MTDMFVYVRKFNNHEVPAVLMGCFSSEWYFGFPMAIDEGVTCAAIFPEEQFQKLKERVSQAKKFTYAGFTGIPISAEDIAYSDEVMPLVQWLEIVNKYGKFPH